MTKYLYTDSFASLNSSLIKSVYYHKGEQKLFVQLNSGALYGYEKVPAYVWDEFSSAASLGNFYNLRIKGKYGIINDVTSVEYFGWKTLEAERTVNRKFVIVGVAPIEYEFEGVTVDDAMADFKRLFPNGTLKEVRVSFE